MSNEYRKCLNKFKEGSKIWTYRSVDKDTHGGIRYIPKLLIDGVEKPVRLPPSFMRFSKIKIDEMYLYCYPDMEDGDDFECLKEAVALLESKVKENIPADSYTELIKSDKKNGMSVKLYGRDGEVTSKFVDKDGEVVDPTDERLTSALFHKTMYPVINVDSVYVSSRGQASIQLKLFECVCYFEKTETALDLDLINRLRAMRLSKK
jgi:hypothetical protein